jgi:Tfp pilus assembly protein PilN
MRSDTRIIADNINLLERKAPSGLASPGVRRALVWSVLLVALSAVALMWQTRDLRSVRHELTRVQAQTERLQHGIAEVPSPEIAMADQLASEEREVVALEAVARTLSTGGLAHTEGFVGTLQAFGRATAEGAWLTGLTVDNRHGSMVVEGRALDASRVPALLQTLRSEPHFAGMTFSAIELTAGTPESAQPSDRALKFRISTPAAEAPAAAPAEAAAAAPSAANRSPAS